MTSKWRFRSGRRTGPELHALLVASSRTFAIAIPSLPEPTRREVTVAYLLCRLLDTIEDAAHWSRERRLAALADVSELVGHPCHARAVGLARELSRGRVAVDTGCQRLVLALPSVIDAYQELPAAALDIVRCHVARMARGMGCFVSRIDGRGQLRLRGVAELREYCYVVAGIAAAGVSDPADA